MSGLARIRTRSMGMWRGGGDRQFFDRWPEHSSPSAGSHTASVNGGRSIVVQSGTYPRAHPITSPVSRFWPPGVRVSWCCVPARQKDVCDLNWSRHYLSRGSPPARRIVRKCSAGMNGLRIRRRSVGGRSSASPAQPGHVFGARNARPATPRRKAPRHQPPRSANYS